jgi:flagellar basal-body rod modification protein FlgD
MTSYASINPFSSASASSQAPASTSGGTSSMPTTPLLTQNDFIKLIVAQLSNQNPDNATDTNQLMQQMMDMSNFQSSQIMSSDMTKMYGQQQQLLAQTLVGSTVQVSDGKGNVQTGVVDQAGVVSGDVQIQVNGQTYSSSNIINVLNNSTNSTNSTTGGS